MQEQQPKQRSAARRRTTTVAMGGALTIAGFAGAATLATLVAAIPPGLAPKSGAMPAPRPGATAAPAPRPSATPTARPTPVVNAACVPGAMAVSGLYPADGTFKSSGSTSNILLSSGIVRSDIRASFLGSTAVATGTTVKITLTLVDSRNNCAPLAGRAVYLWNSDSKGLYSLYTAPKESYLRGVQVTDAKGQVSFTTVFPGGEAGRWPHMYVETYASLSAATGARMVQSITQLAMPAAAANAVYAQASLYSGSAANLAKVTLSTDPIFRHSSAAQLAQQTPMFTGSVAAGYTATATLGLGR